MTSRIAAVAALAGFILVLVPAHGQEQKAQEGDSELPEICRSGGAMPVSPMEMEMPQGIDEAHQARMAGMPRMNRDMALGMMAEDIDVAFVCSMIPHHRGAIEMARAELEYGDDPWVREQAQKIIEAQEQEIRDMLAWLGQQSE